MNKEAMFYTSLTSGRVICRLCARRCEIPSGSRGFCLVRENRGGKLISLVYGKLIAFNVDPITKKPLFHVWPGAGVASISTIGCNFRCQFCINWHFTQASRVRGKFFSPERVIKLAKRYDVQGIAYTYNEPTVFYEFMYDVARLAKREGLFNVMVTNGYMTIEALELLAPYMLAITVDIKANGNIDFHRKFMSVENFKPILEFICELKRKDIFIEITDLVIPEYGDKIEDLRKLVRWIHDNLGPDIPFHLLRFFPDFKMMNHYTTPVETLMKHYKVAKEEGLNYVYIGNVPGHPFESTYCPRCGAILIRRYGFEIVGYYLRNDRYCPNCSLKINIIGHFIKDKWPWVSVT